jgi:hypothetical protein
MIGVLEKLDIVLTIRLDWLLSLSHVWGSPVLPIDFLDDAKTLLPAQLEPSNWPVHRMIKIGSNLSFKSGRLALIEGRITIYYYTGKQIGKQCKVWRLERTKKGCRQPVHTPID